MTETRKQNPRSPFVNRKRSAFKPRQTEKRDQVHPEQVAAFEHMCANRPLVPPPYDFGPVRSNAAAVAAREDRLGIVRRAR